MKKNDKIMEYGLYGGVFLVIVGILYAIFRKPTGDGVDKNGVFDNEVGGIVDLPTGNGENTEGGIGEVLSTNGTTSKTYAQQPVKLKYFKISEFDSKGTGESGTGTKMHVSTLQMLDKARETAGVSFHINSGYRTVAHNKKVGGVANSAHTRGYAADIAAKDQATQVKILKALYAAGFRRFGVYDTFVHADNDPDKQQAFWREGGTTYNPLSA